MFTISDQLILMQIPGCIAWKDKNLKYQGANKNLLITMNFEHPKELVGLSDEDLALNTPELNTFFHEQDLLALQGHSVEVIHDLEHAKDKTYFLQKSPLRCEQGTIIGVVYYCMMWSQADLLTALRQIDQKFQPASALSHYYNIDAHHNPNNLSVRELECLFLQLRGKTIKQTGEILNLSKRTVESYLDNIKAKFGCQSKSELLVAAMIQGYQKHIPKSLINLNLPNLLKT